MKREPDAKAVALKYGVTAPTVTATGTGQLARDIMDLARAHDIPMFENRELAELLSTLGLGDEIPPELYIAVAQILSLAFELQGKAPPGWVMGDNGWEKELTNN